MFKVGIGYDMHRLLKGKKLILGGVEIPYEKGLDGHSDADVLLHAICDALLGALGKGDIGEHFPNTDAQYKGISSLCLLEQVVALMDQEGYVLNNIDATILAQEPYLKDFKKQMKSMIAKTMIVEEKLINIKASTTEGLGFVGRKEAMVAYATVAIRDK